MGLEMSLRHGYTVQGFNYFMDMLNSCSEPFDCDGAGDSNSQHPVDPEANPSILMGVILPGLLIAAAVESSEVLKAVPACLL